MPSTEFVKCKEGPLDGQKVPVETVDGVEISGFVYLPTLIETRKKAPPIWWAVPLDKVPRWERPGWRELEAAEKAEKANLKKAKERLLTRLEDVGIFPKHGRWHTKDRRDAIREFVLFAIEDWKRLADIGVRLGCSRALLRQIETAALTVQEYEAEALANDSVIQLLSRTAKVVGE